MNITFLNVLQWIVYFISLYFSVFWLLVYLERGDEKIPKKLKKFPTVTLAIPAYNEERTIESTINSALKIDYPKDKLEIIVINDGSKDATLEKIKPFLKNKQIKLITHENKGKGASLNDAVRKAKGEFFVCLDADSVVKPDALKKLLKYFTDENVASVMPVMKIKNNGKLNLLQKLQWYEYLLNMFFKKIMSSIDCVHVAPGPFSVYRTKLIRKVGYFDEDNLTEDLELTVRMQMHNYRIIQTMDSEVFTNAMPTMKRYYRQRNRWFKGGLINAFKYRKMMFNPKWGDFGMIQLPILVISGLISLTLIGTMLYDFIKPLINNMINMNSVSFDFITFIRTLSFNFNIYDISVANVLLLIITLSLSIMLLRLSTYYTKEKVMQYNVFIVIAFLFFYFFLLAITWAGVTKDMLVGKIQKW